MRIISIISMIGERQLVTSVNSKTLSERIDLSTYTGGIYFIELRSQGQVAIEKIIISR